MDYDVLIIGRKKLLFVCHQFNKHFYKCKFLRQQKIIDVVFLLAKYFILKTI
jgi:hypothetical protein